MFTSLTCIKGENTITKRSTSFSKIFNLVEDDPVCALVVVFVRQINPAVIFPANRCNIQLRPVLTDDDVPEVSGPSAKAGASSSACASKIL